MQEEIEIWLTPQKKSFMECKQIKSLFEKNLTKKKKTQVYIQAQMSALRDPKYLRER